MGFTFRTSLARGNRDDGVRNNGNRPMSKENLLKIVLVAFGATCILLYPLAIVWPSGWAWHEGAPAQSQYFMMIVGVYATLGAFLINAARNPEANRSLIWFTVVSSIVHALIMAAQSLEMPEHAGHLAGDVPALLIASIVLALLMPRASRPA